MHFVICRLYIVSKSCDRNKLLLSSRCQSSFGLSTKSIRKLAKTHCEIIRLAAVRKLSGSQIERFVSGWQTVPLEGLQCNDPDVYLLSG